MSPLPEEQIENVRGQARAWADSQPGYAADPKKGLSSSTAGGARVNIDGAAAAARAARDAYPSLRAENPYNASA